MLHRICLILLIALAGVSLPLTRAVVAQEVVDTINYTDWQSVAERAEASVAAGLASDKAFESLRSEVVVWRERFLRGQDANAQRIRTLRAQLVALGPPPAEGETEAEEVANRRRELNASLAEALAPVKTAEEAFSRAEGLVREIDGIIRARQTDALLKLAPSPLNPALWPDAVRELVATLKSIGNEVVLSWRSDAKRIALRDGLPKTLLFLVVAVVLLARGRFLMEKLTWLVLDISKGSTRALAGFATSLGQIIVPVLGIYLLVEALQSTGMLGLRGLLVTDWLPLFGLLTFGARWLGLRLFPKRNDVARLFDPTPEQSRTIRLSALLLGILVAAGVLITTVSDYDSYTSGSSVVLIFPIAALVALVLTRVGRVLRLISRTMQDRETPVHGARGVGLVGRAVMIVALAGLVLSAIGYINAGLFLLFPTTFTLGLLGILLLLNELIRDIYAFATRKSYEQARAALVPTLFSIPLILAALPVFALIWGARVADLTELLAKFREGFTFGDTRISPGSFLTFAIVFAALYGATRLVQGALKNSVLPKTKMDIGGQTAIVSGIGYVGIFLAALIAINSAGLDLSSLAIVAGALSVGIGFGLQNIVQNFVSGIILLIERPVAEGDWIEVGGHVGTVRKISVRSTLIETFDRTDVIVPNGDFIAGAVTNWTRTNLIGRIKVPVGVAYGTNTRRVEEILREIANEHPLVTITPEPGIDFLGFGADSLDFQIRAVLSDVNFSVAVRTEMNHRIAERFAEEGIEIPFAQRDIWLRNPEALTGIARPVADPPAQPAASTSAPRELGDSDRELDPTLMSDGGEGEHT